MYIDKYIDRYVNVRVRVCAADDTHKKKQAHTHKHKLAQESSFYKLRKLGDSEEERQGSSVATVRELATRITVLKTKRQPMQSSKNERAIKQQR